MQELRAKGIRIIAPPTFVLLTSRTGRSCRRSTPGRRESGARDHHLDAGAVRTHQRGGDPVEELLLPVDHPRSAQRRDILVVLDVLARDVGILGIFSDWSATVTYYANCMGL